MRIIIRVINARRWPCQTWLAIWRCSIKIKWLAGIRWDASFSVGLFFFFIWPLHVFAHYLVYQCSLKDCSFLYRDCLLKGANLIVNSLKSSILKLSLFNGSRRAFWKATPCFKRQSLFMVIRIQLLTSKRIDRTSSVMIEGAFESNKKSSNLKQ